jgi:hypothetical protein
MKIHPVGAEFLHANGRKNRETDMKKLIVAFRSFAKSPESDKLIWLKCVMLFEYNIEGDRITLCGLCVRLVLMVNLNTILMLKNMVNCMLRGQKRS